MRESENRTFTNPNSYIVFTANVVLVVATCSALYVFGDELKMSESTTNFYVGIVVFLGFLFNTSMGMVYGEMPVSGLVVRKSKNPILFFLRLSISIFLSLFGLFFAVSNF